MTTPNKEGSDGRRRIAKTAAGPLILLRSLYRRRAAVCVSEILIMPRGTTLPPVHMIKLTEEREITP
jgi:hypothetical protein